MLWREWKPYLVEIGLALMICAICAPGVIWWIKTLWELVP